MKFVFALVFLLVLAFGWTPLRADGTKQVAYEPAVVTLSGTIVKEGFGDDASPIDRGKQAWILRLDQRISVPAKPGDEIDTEERNVTEVHLNIDPTKRRLPARAFGQVRYAATGTLYHAHTTHHLRPIVMLVSNLTPATPNARHRRDPRRP